MKIKNWLQGKLEEREVARFTGYGKAEAKRVYEETLSKGKRKMEIEKARKKAKAELKRIKDNKLSFKGMEIGTMDDLRKTFKPMGEPYFKRKGKR